MKFYLNRLAFLFALLAVTGCAASSTLPDDLTGIRSGIAAARDQARISFDATNKLALAQGIDRKLSLPEQTLSEKDFPTPVSTRDAAAWNTAFGILDTYGAALQSLVDPKRATATADEIGKLVTAINAQKAGVTIPSSLSGLFQTFGEALVQSEGEASAIAIMQKTDSAFNAVVGGMATAIGASPADLDSLQHVVQSNWNNSVLVGIENRYLSLKLGDAARRQVLTDYTTAMTSRDAQLANLSQLHDSLLALGQAHAAAARGKPGDALFWIGRINSWLDDIKTRSAAAQKAGDAK